MEIDQRLGRRATAGDLIEGGYDQVILATGVTPRRPQMEGMDHPKVVFYGDVLLDKTRIGQRVAIMGAGGIGFDVAEFLAHPDPDARQSGEDFLAYWGIDGALKTAGGLSGRRRIPEPAREIYLLQRKTARHGGGLGKTTGWITRARLQNAQVQLLGGVTYERMDDAGLHITMDGQRRILEVDNLVVCAGQEPLRDLQDGLQAAGLAVHLIGGAEQAVELDARRAIDQGARLAAAI